MVNSKYIEDRLKLSIAGGTKAARKLSPEDIENERERLLKQEKKIKELREKYPIPLPGPYKPRIFSEAEMAEMAKRALKVYNQPKRYAKWHGLEHYQGLLPGEHIRVR